MAPGACIGLALLFAAACGGESSSGSSGGGGSSGTAGATGSGGTAGTAASGGIAGTDAGSDSGPGKCGNGELCCSSGCLKIECRPRDGGCLCGSTELLAENFVDAAPVESCAPPDGGVCCMDLYAGDCVCGSCPPFEGQPVAACSPSMVTCGVHGPGVCE